MAGKISAKNAVIVIDDIGGTPRDVSIDCDSFEIEQDAGKVEVTGFTEGGKNYIPGMPVYGVTFNFIWNRGYKTKPRRSTFIRSSFSSKIPRST